MEAVDRRFATAKIYAIVAQTLAGKVEEVRRKERLGQFKEEEITEPEKETAQDKKLTESILAKADLSLSYSKEEYRKRLEQLQKKMEKLHGELYRRRIPVVLGFEGWDAQPLRMISKGLIIICGGSGWICQRLGILPYLTEPGTAGSW